MPSVVVYWSNPPGRRKRSAFDGWQEADLNINTVSTWADARPGELSTGIRTRYTPGFDIDIRDADVADQVQQALLNLLPQGTLLKRVGLAPRRSLRARGRRCRSIRG